MNFPTSIAKENHSNEFLSRMFMFTYLVCERDELRPFVTRFDSPESIAIEIAVAIEHEYAQNQLAAYEASSNNALVARLADKALFEVDLDENLIKVWQEQARPLVQGFDSLDLRDEFYHACNDLDRKLSDLNRICQDSNYFDDVEFDMDSYLDSAATAFFGDIEYLLEKKLINIYSFKAVAQNS